MIKINLYYDIRTETLSLVQCSRLMPNQRISKCLYIFLIIIVVSHTLLFPAHFFRFRPISDQHYDDGDSSLIIICYVPTLSTLNAAIPTDLNRIVRLNERVARLPLLFTCAVSERFRHMMVYVRCIPMHRKALSKSSVKVNSIILYYLTIVLLYYLNCRN